MLEGTSIGGRYKLERLIGEGPWGPIYTGVDSDGSRAAIEVANPQPQDLGRVESTFRREVRLGTLLGDRWPRFVLARAWGPCDGGVYLVRDQVPGGKPLDLRAKDREWRLKQLIKAGARVWEAHRSQLVHRDVRPRSFLIDHRGKVHLTHFGQAKLLDPAQRAELRTRDEGIPFNSSPFVAPEQSDPARVDPRADVYALGAMLHLALSGEYPSNRLGGPELRDLDSSIPNDLADLCRRALQPDPAHRLPDVEAFLDGLGAKKKRTKTSGRPRPGRLGPSTGTGRFRPPSGGFPAVRPTATPEQPRSYPTTRRLYRKPVRPIPAKPRVFLDNAQETLDQLGGAVVRRGEELKFAWGPDRLGLSLHVATDKRHAILEQRITLERDKLVGQPTGEVNLLHAANAINRTSWELRCVLSADRLRFRRELLLAGRVSAPSDELRAHLDAFLQPWTELFAGVKQVEQGAPWQELRLPPPLTPGPTSELERLLLAADLEPQLAEDGRLTVVLPGGQLRLISDGSRILASCLLHPWRAPRSELQAISEGRHAPAIEALLEELNQKNHERFYTLAWDPDRGVVARALFAEGIQWGPQRVLAFLSTIDAARLEERLETLLAAHDDALAWLCCDPFPPLALRPDAQLTIGRAGCDLVLPHHSISRIHGVLRVIGNQIQFEDRSSNGSLINGKRVTGSLVRLGDIITMGPYDLELAREPQGKSDPGTVDMDFAMVMSGLLEEHALVETLQTLEFNSKTGTLKLLTEHAKGHVVFKEGVPWSAELEQLRGVEAIFAMLELTEGRFVFWPGVEETERDVTANVTAILLELSRRQDEG